MTLAAWHVEIIDLHDFFQDWLTGTVPDTDAAYARLIDTTDPAFTLITPGGAIVSGAALIAELRVAHGSRPNWRMWIERAELHARSGDLTLVTYEEWHESAAGVTSRVATAVFRDKPGAPNGLAWLHVHETWLSHQGDTMTEPAPSGCALRAAPERSEGVKR